MHSPAPGSGARARDEEEAQIAQEEALLAAAEAGVGVSEASFGVVGVPAAPGGKVRAVEAGCLDEADGR